MNLSVQNMGQTPTTIQFEGELNTEVDGVVMILTYQNQEVFKGGGITNRCHQFTMTLHSGLEPYYHELALSVFGFQSDQLDQPIYRFHHPLQSCIHAGRVQIAERGASS